MSTIPSFLAAFGPKHSHNNRARSDSSGRLRRLNGVRLNRLELLEERTLLSLGGIGIDPLTMDSSTEVASGSLAMVPLIQDEPSQEASLSCQTTSVDGGNDASAIAFRFIASPPTPPTGVGHKESIVNVMPQSAVMLSQVPTSTWTFGCSATSAGMIFGYYDRTGYPNMYTGPTNGGVAPLTDLGQGIGTPIPGSCSIIATANGFDGRSTAGHVDDYWISNGSDGPDPWTGGTEHAWGDCTADYMGTNQWKWDLDGNGTVESNSDGSTSVFYNMSGAPLNDYIPPVAAGTPQTALCHGMKLFAESRGYTVAANYTQNTYNKYSDGFTFSDYQAEIDAGYPVMIQVEGHSMVGMGYDAATSTVYLHDTWDNLVHTMTWDASPAYSGMGLWGVTVIHLDPSGVEYDFGDAPDPGYPTKASSNGAAHAIGGPWLGDSSDAPDAEPDGQPAPNALGDDNDGNDDEDGVVVPPMMPGHSSAVTVEVNGVPAGAAAQLDAWIDFDGSGTWEPAEHLFAGVSQSVSTGVNVLPFQVPAGAISGTTFGRFRISTQGNLTPLGLASDGEVEDHELTILDRPEGTKWIQWPDLSPNGIDVLATSDAERSMTLADDWLCTEESLLTDVHLWGSWLGDVAGEIETLHLSVHSDDPVGPEGSIPDNNYSLPDQLLWEMDFTRGEIGMNPFYTAPEFGEYWWDPESGQLTPDADKTVWQLDVDIDPAAAFRQMGSPNEPTIYWLDVSVTTTAGEFGWKTRQYPDHDIDDAVWQGSDPAVWNEMLYPPGHPYVVEEASIDLAFMLTFQPPQDKWVQWPDETPNGIDVKATTGPDGSRIVLADDWVCTEPSLLTDVHLWGSWLTDDVGTIENLHLSVHSDDPVGEGGSSPDNNYSMPDQLLWEMDFAAAQIGMTPYFTLPDLGEFWWDPVTGQLIPNADRNIWQVDVLIDPADAFYQQGTPENPTIYWLDVNVKTSEGTEFGWKTRQHPDHDMDDAVWHYDGIPDPYWNEMLYPPGHPYEDDPQNSIDLAFRLTFEPIADNLDWGDAPDGPLAPGYPTLSGNNGASHVIGGPWLGDGTDNPDAEPDGQPDPNALGDDNDGNDDEDGVTFGALTTGTTGSVTLEISGTAAVVDAWIDFNGDGVWSEPSERISGAPALAVGVHTLNFNVPANAKPGSTFARFRVSSAGGLSPAGPAADGEVEDYEVSITADYDDLVGRVSTTGDWYVARSTGTAFASSYWGKWSPNVSWVDVQVGDFDGDGKDDLVGRVSTTGDWYVATSSGTAFTSSHWGKWSPNVNWVDVQVGDFDGDGKDDLVGRVSTTGDWYVAKSNGTAFTSSHWGKWSPNVTWVNVQVGDFSGDGKDDLVGRVSTTGDWYVATSGGTAFTSSYWGKWSPNVNWTDIQVGDFSGDGKDDLVGRVSTTGKWYVAKSSGTAFTSSLWGTWSPNVNWVDVQVGDFSGDGKDDLVGRVVTTGKWYVAKSSGTAFTSSLWGTWSPNVVWVDVQVGNFDGASTPGKYAPKGDPLGAWAAADKFWAEVGDDDEDSLALESVLIELLKLEE